MKEMVKRQTAEATQNTINYNEKKVFLFFKLNIVIG